MAQYCERFEQGCPQPPVLPGGFFNHYLEQPALLGRGLLEEQFACPTRQTERVNGLIEGRRRVVLDIPDLPRRPFCSRRQLSECVLKNSSVMRPSSLSRYLVSMRA